MNSSNNQNQQKSNLEENNLHHADQQVLSKEIFQDVRATVIKHLPQYGTEDIVVKPLSGLTNQTYKIECNSLDALVFRKFSDIYDRQLENLIFLELEKGGITPKCMYACQQYRIEKFINNSVHPSLENLKTTKIKERILKLMHKYHSMDIDLLKGMPLFLDYVLSSEFLDKLKLHKNDKPEAQFAKLFDKVIYEFTNLDQSKYSLNPKYSNQNVAQTERVKFCHNDLNNLNIFFEPETMFIDYEYSSYNYVAYDIANFLNESTIDYGVKESPGFNVTYHLEYKDILEAAQLYPGKYEGLSIQIVKGLVLCNLYWAAWSVMMTANSPSNSIFQIVKHGQKRLELYQHYKKLLTKVVQNQ